MSQQLVNVSQLFENATTKKRLLDALPKHLTPERMIRIAVTEYNRSAALRNCDPMSFVSAIMESAQLGLEPASSLHYAYLVPYAGQVKLMIGYRGFVALVRRHPDIKNFWAHAAHEGDEFSYRLGLNPDIQHEPKGLSENLTHVYGVVVFKDGSTEFQVMTRAQVEKVRDRFSRKDKKTGKHSEAWLDSFDEMAKKTVIRRMVKTLPMSNELQRAIENETGAIIDIDSEDNSNAPVHFLSLSEEETPPTATQEEIAQKEGAELLDALNKKGFDTKQYQEILKDGDARKIIAVVQVMKEELTKSQEREVGR